MNTDRSECVCAHFDSGVKILIIIRVSNNYNNFIYTLYCI